MPTLTRSLTRHPPGTASAHPLLDVAAGALLLLVVAAANCWVLDLPTSHVLQAAALYVVLGFLVLSKRPPELPGPGIGPANRVTLARAALVLPTAALVLRPEVGDAAYWWILAVSTLAMVMDGVDGMVARWTDTESAYGARFDMEIDAFLLMALSWIVWQSGKVGVWVLLIGGLRYLFVLAGFRWPALRGELPESMRRKVVCVLQGVSLLVCLAPITFAAMASIVAAGSLVLLAYSFAVDVRWLMNPMRT
jgi:phosphatidylglycerophosphate synthase